MFRIVTRIVTRIAASHFVKQTYVDNKEGDFALDLQLKVRGVSSSTIELYVCCHLTIGARPFLCSAKLLQTIIACQK